MSFPLPPWPVLLFVVQTPATAVLNPLPRLYPLLCLIHTQYRFTYSIECTYTHKQWSIYVCYMYYTLGMSFIVYNVITTYLLMVLERGYNENSISKVEKAPSSISCRLIENVRFIRSRVICMSIDEQYNKENEQSNTG